MQCRVISSSPLLYVEIRRGMHHVNIWLRNVLRGIFENYFTQKKQKNILQDRRNELKNKSFYVKPIFFDHRCAKLPSEEIC